VPVKNQAIKEKDRKNTPMKMAKTPEMLEVNDDAIPEANRGVPR